MKRKLISLCLLPILAFGHWALDFDEDFAAAAAEKPDVLDGLVAWWKMDESSWDGTAGEVVDSIFTNNGYSIGGATTVEGKILRAGSFDGVDDYVLTTLNMLQYTNLSISCWVNPSNGGNSYRWVVSQDDGGYDWGLLWHASHWKISFGAGFWDTGVSVNFGVYVHLVVVFTSGVNIEFYANGIRYARGAAPSECSSGSRVTFGRSPIYSTERFSGIIDDVRIYNRALSSNEVSTIYNRFK